MTTDLYRASLQEMVDPHHPLVILTGRFPWATLEEQIAPLLVPNRRSPKVFARDDLFGPSFQIAGVGAGGRPRLPSRLMIALLYLKHAFNLSDEALCERWSESVPWQYFSGQIDYEPRLPCDPTHLGRFRNLLGEAGVEALLKEGYHRGRGVGPSSQADGI